jgi:hypothetical protein
MFVQVRLLLARSFEEIQNWSTMGVVSVRPKVLKRMKGARWEDTALRFYSRRAFFESRPVKALMSSSRDFPRSLPVNAGILATNRITFINVIHQEIQLS